MVDKMTIKSLRKLQSFASDNNYILTGDDLRKYGEMQSDILSSDFQHLKKAPGSKTRKRGDDKPESTFKPPRKKPKRNPEKPTPEDLTAPGVQNTSGSPTTTTSESGEASTTLVAPGEQNDPDDTVPIDTMHIDVLMSALMERRRLFDQDNGQSRLLEGNDLGHPDWLTTMRVMQQDSKHLLAPNGCESIPDLYKPTEESLENLFTDGQCNNVRPEKEIGDFFEIIQGLRQEVAKGKNGMNVTASYMWAAIKDLAIRYTNEGSEASHTCTEMAEVEDTRDDTEAWDLDKAPRKFTQDTTKRTQYKEHLNTMISDYIHYAHSKMGVKSKHILAVKKELYMLHLFRMKKFWVVIAFHNNSMSKLMNGFSSWHTKDTTPAKILRLGRELNGILMHELQLQQITSRFQRAKFLSLDSSCKGLVKVPVLQFPLEVAVRHFTMRPQATHGLKLFSIQAAQIWGWSGSYMHNKEKSVCVYKLKREDTLISVRPLLPGDFLGYIHGIIEDKTRNPDLSSKTHYPGPGIFLRPKGCPLSKLHTPKHGTREVNFNVGVAWETFKDTSFPSMSGYQGYRWAAFALEAIPAFEELVSFEV